MRKKKRKCQSLNFDSCAFNFFVRIVYFLFFIAFCCSRCIYSSFSIKPPFLAGFLALFARLACNWASNFFSSTEARMA